MIDLIVLFVIGARGFAMRRHGLPVLPVILGVIVAVVLLWPFIRRFLPSPARRGAGPGRPGLNPEGSTRLSS